MVSGYRGEGHTIQPGCTLQAHYVQVQAYCDALGFAAQQLQAKELELAAGARASAEMAVSTQSGSEDIATYLQLAEQHASKADYWYGVFQGYRGLLRAIEGNTGELEPNEQEMLARIVWDHEPPYFAIPGFEAVQGQPQVLPGTEPT